MNYLKGVLGVFVLVLMIFVGVNGWTAEKTVVLGYTAPLSGPGADYGRDCVNGVDMAVNEINKAGGIMVKGQKVVFKLEKLDDRIDPTQAVNNSRRFRDQYKAPAIYNPVTNTLLPMMQINQEKGNEFMVMAYTSTPQVTNLKNKLVVAIPPNFEVYVKAFSDIAWGQGSRKAAMV
ncbi:MAG: ABC transporter substrate-binding protein, partial [Thermodesulfobacteriota bacterium]